MMSRYPRPVFADIPLHIIQRGNNRSPCFFSRSDYQHYLDILAEAAHRFPCNVHAYVLMPNHVHILATPAEVDAPASMMKWLGQKYVQYVNKKYSRSGTLWQGRYRSCLVENERYFIICQRYIELNPVRAEITATPADYEWSSYRTNAHGQRSRILAPHPIYLGIAADPTERQASYRALFDREMPEFMIEQIRGATNSNMFFGSDGFSQKMAYQLGRPAFRQQAGRHPAA